VVSPEDAEGMFDILTYEKGAAVVRMLEQYLGEDEFRAGIRRYMEQHKFSNAETTDLWDALEAETGEPVRRIMDSWIFQGGYPLVDVSPGQSDITLTQSRMRYVGGDESAEQTWAIPLRYRMKHAGSEEPTGGRTLLDGDAPATLGLTEIPEWFVANAEGASFIRATYTDDMLGALAELDQDQLSAVERYGILDDAWAAVLADQRSTPAYLNLLESMTAETNRSVWQRIIGGFSQLKRLTAGEASERLEEIAHDALAPALANLGLAPSPDDDDQQRQLRGDLVRAIGTIANDPEIQEEAARAVATGRRDPELVETSLMAAGVDVVAANGDEADFDDFIDAWKSASTPQEELRYLGALCDFPEPELIERIYQLILDGQIRSQNAPMLLRRALVNRDAGRQTWEFITGNWDQLTDMFASSLIVRMVDGLTVLNYPGDVDLVAGFFAEHQVPTGHQTLVQTLERQRVYAALREREAQRLSAFLTS
jgi:puromycin-sensitive aminopeptidase